MLSKAEEKPQGAEMDLRQTTIQSDDPIEFDNQVNNFFTEAMRNKYMIRTTTYLQMDSNKLTVIIAYMKPKEPSRIQVVR